MRHSGWIPISLLQAAVFTTAACGLDVPVGTSPGSGGLPRGDLLARGGATGTDRPEAGTFEGTWRAADLGLEGLDGIKRITGDLVVEGTDATGLVLFDLEAVDGDLVVCANPDLANVNVGALREVGGRFRLCDLPLTTSLSAPLLTHTGGALILERVPELGVVTLTALASLGGLALRGIGASSLSLPALQTLEGDLALDAPTGSALATLTLEALTGVDRDVDVRAHPTLRTLSAPSLSRVGGALRIEDNPLLRNLELGALTSVGAGGCICDNADLPTCEVEHLALEADGGVVTVEGNDPGPTCP